MVSKSAVLKIGVILGCGLLAGLVWWVWQGQVDELRTYAPDLSQVAYVGSESCRACHQDQFAHWSQSHHHKMTQPATPEAVVGDFNNATYTYQGVTSRMFRRGDEFFMETLDPSGRMGVAKIVRTVGSRRFQQYVTQVGTTFYRLPIAWNIEKKYWFNLQGLFLHPDLPDFSHHTSVWNNNCIFCHNVKGKPGMDLKTGQFTNTRVEELGIGCEACHGPGKLHVEKNQAFGWTWLRRQARADDPTIVNQAKRDKRTNTQVCGHCHGQRLPVEINNIREIMAKGDPYTPGEDLSKYYRPLDITAKVGDYSFAPRFYPDGTPRLTAYEYQGLLMSKCHTEGNMTCVSCHDVHKGRQQSLMHDEMRGNKSCTQCHANIAANLEAHTHHRADSSGSACYECHRPRISFGLLTAKRTHRILNPEPDKSLSTDMPNGCNMCHPGESADWAARYMTQWYGPRYALSKTNAARPEARIAEIVRELFSRDPSARITAAWALGTSGADGRARDRQWAIPFLIEALRDRYPAVRYFAYDALRSVSGEDFGFFYLADERDREAVIARYADWWRNLPKGTDWVRPSSVPLDANWQIPATRLAAFRAELGKSGAIDIGE